LKERFAALKSCAKKVEFFQMFAEESFMKNPQCDERRSPLLLEKEPRNAFLSVAQGEILMDLKTTLQNDMKSAMKSQEPTKVGCLRMLIAEIKKREIDKRSPLDTAEIQKVIATLIKQRGESVTAFEKGGRADLADKEKAEIEVLKVYLPQQLSQAEVEALVVAAINDSGATGPNDIGKVMKAALAKADGRADGKLVNEIARAKLTPSA
jgi:uncharacterized protein YqeY